MVWGNLHLVASFVCCKKIGRGTNRIRDLLKPEDFSKGRTEIPVRIEITSRIDGKQFDYTIAFELPKDFREARIREESLQVDGDKIYDRTEAQVNLVADNSSFMVDWHFVALPIIQMRGSDNVLETFKTWLSQLIIIAPVPSLISGEANEDSLFPNKSVSNFAAWFSGVLGRYPASWSVIEAPCFVFGTNPTTSSHFPKSATWSLH